MRGRSLPNNKMRLKLKKSNSIAEFTKKIPSPRAESAHSPWSCFFRTNDPRPRYAGLFGWITAGFLPEPTTGRYPNAKDHQGKASKKEDHPDELFNRSGVGRRRAKSADRFQNIHESRGFSKPVRGRGSRNLVEAWKPRMGICLG